MAGIQSAILACPRRKMTNVKEMWRHLSPWLQSGGPMSQSERGSKMAVLMVLIKIVWDKILTVSYI